MQSADGPDLQSADAPEDNVPEAATPKVAALKVATPKAYKTIGIMGGMGPLAAVDLFNKIVTNTAADSDQEHIPIIIDSNPQIPDRTAFLLRAKTAQVVEAASNPATAGFPSSSRPATTGPVPSNPDISNPVPLNPAPLMIESAKRLESSGADFILIACNTAHYFIDEVSAAVGIPVINAIKEAAAEASRLGFKKVAVLGTEGFIRHVDYPSYYSKAGVSTISPSAEEQNVITRLIYEGVKANKRLERNQIAGFLAVLDKLKEQKAEAFVLACTELPIAFDMYGISGYRVIDPGLVLARKAIALAGGRQR